jgi:signal transduction histidine kinase
VTDETVRRRPPRSAPTSPGRPPAREAAPARQAPSDEARGLGLRGRLAAAFVVVVLPTAGLASLLAVRLERQAVAESIADALVARYDERARARCEEDPARFSRRPLGREGADARPRRGGRWPRRGPLGPEGWPARLHVYDDALRPVAGPPLDPALRDALRARDVAHGVRGDRLVVAVRVADAGPCSVLSVTRPARAPLRGALIAAAAVAAVALVVLLAVVGPTVRRIRRLERAVREGTGIPDGPRDELGALAEALGRARAEVTARIAQLEARDRALSRYVADTTHDLAVPLTVLTGHLAALPPSPEARAALEEAHYLSALLANLAVAAKLDARAHDGAEPSPDRTREAGALEGDPVGLPPLARHPVDLAALVERVVARHAPLAARRGVALEHAVPEAPLGTRGDVTLLEQAVSNLVHNAVRYTPEGGHVAVVLEREGSDFVVRVADDGPGVPDAELARLTERGFRGDAARARTVGSGLGLSIAHDVARRHGFTLTLESGEPGGLAASPPSERAGLAAEPRREAAGLVATLRGPAADAAPDALPGPARSRDRATAP